jgi:hypothetical protein
MLGTHASFYRSSIASWTRLSFFGLMSRQVHHFDYLATYSKTYWPSLFWFRLPEAESYLPGLETVSSTVWEVQAGLSSVDHQKILPKNRSDALSLFAGSHWTSSTKGNEKVFIASSYPKVCSNGGVNHCQITYVSVFLFLFFNILCI